MVTTLGDKSAALPDGELLRQSQSLLLPIDQILDYAAKGLTPEQIVAELPELLLSDIYTAMACAADLLRQHFALELGLQGAPSALPAGELNLKKILIVDDLEPNRRLMELMFRGSDFEIVLAHGGQDGLLKVREHMPFLVISDVQMPGMSGYDLCEQLKADSVTESVAVIFVTAHHRNVDYLAKGLNLGANDYIYRPFQREELLARVRAMARLKAAEALVRKQTKKAEQHNKELELLNKLALAVSSSQDLEHILPLSLQKLAQLLDAEAVALFLLGSARSPVALTLVKSDGRTLSTPIEFFAEDVKELQDQAPELLAAIIRDSDLTLACDSAGDAPLVRSIPMESRERALGILSILNKRSGAFSVSDWVLLISATGLVAAAVENSWLWKNVQQQVADLTLLNQVGQTLTSTLELDRVLHDTTRLVQEALDADLASLWLFNEERTHLVLTASSGPRSQAITGYQLPLEKGIAGYVSRTGEAYFSADVLNDDKHDFDLGRFSDYIPGSMLCVPLRIVGRVIGVVQALHSQLRWFSPSDLQLFESVNSSVGIAIENARLFNEVQSFNQQLERMVAERTRELEQEKERTLAIIANMADALIVVDAERRVIIANMVAEEMLHFQLQDVVDQMIPETLLGSPLWCCVDDLARSPELRSGRAVDLVNENNPEEVISIQARSSKMWTETGQVAGTVIVLRDVTALKSVERMKARFMAGVTHELKTPLAVIRMHANNLQTYSRRLPERKRKVLLSAIDKQVNLLEKLVGGILELAHLDAASVSTTRQKTNIGLLVDQVLEDLRPLAREKRLKLSWSKPKTVLAAMVDPHKIEQVIRNLVDNAIKYTEAGGKIAVEVSKIALEGRAKIGIRVTDTGIGISEDTLPHIFGRFYRVDPSHTIPGTGLGLAIVKEIVAAHNGEIQVESELGSGSAFFVTLPALESD